MDQQGSRQVFHSKTNYVRVEVRNNDYNKWSYQVVASRSNGSGQSILTNANDRKPA